MKLRALLIVPILLLGIGSIIGTGGDNANDPKYVSKLPKIDCSKADTTITISSAKTKQTGNGWVTTVTGKVTCASPAAGTPVSGASVGVQWGPGDFKATTDKTGAFTYTSKAYAAEPTGDPVAAGVNDTDGQSTTTATITK